MHRILTLTASLIFFLSSINAQQLLSHEEVASYTTSQIEDVATAFGFPAGIISIDYAMKAYKVTYNTTHPDGSTVLASGLIWVPQNYTCPLPLGSYQHGTVLLKSNVPSNLNGESNLGLLYGTGGYIMCMPDFIGLGDSPGLHPYVHAESQAQAVVDILRSARELGTILNANISDQLFLFGYSQGGHATMAAHKIIQEEHSPEFTVTASIPMSGPYDIGGVQASVVTSSVPYPTPGYLPYVLFSYQMVYGNLFDSIQEIIVEPYASQIEDFYDGTHSLGEVNLFLPNNVASWLTPSFINSFENDPNNPVRLALLDNNLYDWIPEAPIHMLYCNGDDQVFAANTDVAFAAFTAAGANDISKSDLGDYDHGTCAGFAFLGGRNLMDQYVDISNGLDFSIAITPESNPSANNASAEVIINGGVGGYTYLWNTGETSAILSGVPGGFYSVVVTDADGCSQSQVAIISTLTDVNNLSTKQIRLSPNPTSESIEFTVPEEGLIDVQIFTSTGKIVENFQTESTGIIRQDLSHLPEGIYYIKAIGQEQYLGKVMLLK